LVEVAECEVELIDSCLDVRDLQVCGLVVDEKKKAGGKGLFILFPIFTPPWQVQTNLLPTMASFNALLHFDALDVMSPSVN
jgi:hypothetical protein